MRNRFFVGETADHVVRVNPGYYGTELLDIIPEELLDTEYTSKTAMQLGIEIDKIRFQKQEELAAMLGKESDLQQAINSPKGTLTPDQEKKKKEIKFLSNVALTILHWG